MSQFCQSIVKNKWFSAFIIFMILVTGVLVGLETDKEIATTYSELFTSLQHFILFIFTVEMVLKIAAEGSRPWRYFFSPWNLFDFFIVVTGMFDLMLTMNATNAENTAFLPVLRLFRLVRLLRVIRVLRLISIFDELQLIIGTLFKSIPSIGYVGMFLMLLFYIYGVLGALLFGDNDPVHFGSLSQSMLTMLGIVTLNEWSTVMRSNFYGCNIFGYDTESLKPLCTAPEAHPIASSLFFVSFACLGTMIMLNMFIGVITNNITKVRESQEAERLVEQRAADNTTIADEIKLIQQKLERLKGTLDAISLRVDREKPNSESST